MKLEKEQIENALRGFYRTGCFDIYLEGNFDQDLTRMSHEDLGTFLHEYVHFLQNISTPYGIFEAVTLNEAAVETFIDILPKKKIELPYDAPQSEELKSRLNWLEAMNGQSVIDQDYSIEVDESKEIMFGRMNVTFHDRKGRIIVLEFNDKLGNVHRRVIGALDIKEAMAAAYQSLIDPAAEHPDIPYNLLRMFCKQHFPAVGNDVKKFDLYGWRLLSACHPIVYSMPCHPSFHFSVNHGCGNNGKCSTSFS